MIRYPVLLGTVRKGAPAGRTTKNGQADSCRLSV